MYDLLDFDFADGEIINVFIGASDTKVAFMRWDGKQFDLTFMDCSYVLCNCINGDIGGVTVKPLEKGISSDLDDIFTYYCEDESPFIFSFLDAWDDKCKLALVAVSAEIVQSS
jgi:hypothetical protein